MERIALHVMAARRAHRLALRFAAKGDSFNANQARAIALRAIQAARDIAQKG